MNVVLVDYGAGNLRSAAKAFEAAGARSVEITSDPERVAKADRIVLPGDGAFPDCRRGLASVDGLDEALEEAVRGARPAVLRHLHRHAAPRDRRPGA